MADDKNLDALRQSERDALRPGQGPAAKALEKAAAIVAEAEAEVRTAHEAATVALNKQATKGAPQMTSNNGGNGHSGGNGHDSSNPKTSKPGTPGSNRDPALSAAPPEGQDATSASGAAREANKSTRETENSSREREKSKTIFSHAAPEGAAKKVSEVLGEITWLMSQSPLHKRFFIEDLEWFVMTPVLLQQFRIFYAKDRPVGVVFWATVNDEVEAMLIEGVTKLRPQDWKSGEPAQSQQPGTTPTSGSVDGQEGTTGSNATRQSFGAPPEGQGATSAPGAAREAEQTFRETKNPQHPKIWVVEAIAPFGGAEEMLQDLKANVFPDKPVHYVSTTAEGKQVKVV